MKNGFLSVIAVVGFASLAVAGPNAGGTLIVVSDGEIYTSDNSGYCGSLPLDTCPGPEAGTYNDTNGIVLHVMATFDDAASPRLAGVVFGIAYNEAEIFLSETGACGDFELGTDTWPASGQGTAITWNTAQTNTVNDVYWFGAYNYYGNPNTFDLTPHPTQGSSFADDAIPANVDDIAGLGFFGFATDGHVPCPAGGVGACCDANFECTIESREDCESSGRQYIGDGTACDPTPCEGPLLGACCVQDQCSVRTELECDASGGDYQGDDTVCEPETCQPTPTLETSWGQVKSAFR